MCLKRKGIIVDKLLVLNRFLNLFFAEHKTKPACVGIAYSAHTRTPRVLDKSSFCVDNLLIKKGQNELI
jgi:hypothetical protein